MKIESIASLVNSAYTENAKSARNGPKAQKTTEDVASEKRDSGVSVPVMEKAVSSKNSDFMSQQDEAKEDNETKEGQVSRQQIEKAVEQANHKIRRADGTSLEFSYHEATKRVSIQVINRETKEVIREIPPEKSLDMLQKMWELAGILVDEKR